MADESTQGGRIKAVREARGRGGKPQGGESFVSDMNAVLPPEERLTSTTLWRWENGEGGPSFRQGLAIIALDPLKRGVSWFAGEARPAAVPPADRSIPHPDTVRKRKGKSA